MNCKRINAELLPYKEYNTDFINNQKIYDYIEEILEYDTIEQENTSYYTITEQWWIKYWVEYCIKYRPLWLSERILQRGWWNDEWIWKDDWVFNDWNI